MGIINWMFNRKLRKWLKKEIAKLKEMGIEVTSVQIDAMVDEINENIDLFDKKKEVSE